MKRVIIESPYAGDVERNLRYLRACMADALNRGEAPFASHGLYTQPGVLDDTKPDEREHGIRAGFVWRDVAEATAIYRDLGITDGMRAGIDHANTLGHVVEYRLLGGGWARKAHVQAKTCLRGGGPVSNHCGCYHCTLGVCEVCGAYEGSLTTDCPGVAVTMAKQKEVYETLLDYTHERGWHQGEPMQKRSPRFAMEVES